MNWQAAATTTCTARFHLIGSFWGYRKFKFQSGITRKRAACLCQLNYICHTISESHSTKKKQNKGSYKFEKYEDFMKYLQLKLDWYNHYFKLMLNAACILFVFDTSLTCSLLPNTFTTSQYFKIWDLNMFDLSSALLVSILKYTSVII